MKLAPKKTMSSQSLFLSGNISSPKNVPPVIRRTLKDHLENVSGSDRFEPGGSRVILPGGRKPVEVVKPTLDVKVVQQLADINPKDLRASPGGLAQLPWSSFSRLSSAQKTILRRCALWAMESSEQAIQYIGEPAASSLAFMAPILEKFPMATPLASGKLRGNKHWMGAMIKRCPELIYCATSRLLDDADFVAPALRQNSLLIRFISERLQDDGDFLVEFLKSGPAGAFYISPRLRQDDDFMRPLAHWSPFGFGASSESLRDDRALALKTVSRFGGMYSSEYLPDAIWRDREVALAAIRGHGEAIRHVPSDLINDYSFLLEAVTENYTVIENVPPFLLGNEEALTEAGKANALIFFSDAISLEMKQRIFSSSPEIEKDFVFFQEGLQNLGIHHVARIPHAATLRGIINNRTSDNLDSGMKNALVVFPKDDWNDVFKTNSIRNLHEGQGYRVTYVEVANDEEFLEAARTSGEKNPIDLLIVAGHGTPTRLAFGEAEPAYLELKHEERFLDFSDASQLKALPEFMAPESKMVLKSCSAGRGGAGANNLARFLHDLMPYTTVFGATHPMNNTLELDSRGEFISPGFWLSAEGTTIIAPKTR